MGDSAAYNLMVGLGEQYLPAFALAAGLGEVAAGLIATIPLLIGAAAQLLAPCGLRLLGTHRRWIVLCVTLQAATFPVLVVAALAGWLPLWLVFGTVAVYWGAGLSSSPAWNTWMGAVIPSRLRALYFARRTHIGQAALLVAFLVAGFSLQAGKAHDMLLPMFALIFALAAASRFASATFLYLQSEPRRPIATERHVPLAELGARLRSGHDGALLLYLLAVQCAVQISGPYFNPYMLNHLSLSYIEYVTIVGAAWVGRIISLPLLGQFARRFGAERLLWLGGVGIAPLSAAWLISDRFAFLIGLQLVVGVAWGAYELAMALLFLEAIAPEERTSVLTRFYFAHALATVVGSLVGAATLAVWGKSVVVYLALFAASSVARLAALPLLWRMGRATPRAVDLNDVLDMHTTSGELSAAEQPRRIAA
ncbi:MAG: MFS transporter [Planctomycetes bacterium]|nr:MFS transporter [Planctomycetota bacterium]